MPLARLKKPLRHDYPSNMDLYFLPEISAEDKRISFPKDESRHLSKVVRKKEDDQIRATNGKGLEMVIRLTLIGNNQCQGEPVEIIQHTKANYELHLAIAPTKNMNRMEWFLEKATEIGIHHITPILCTHSERKIIKPERLNKIIIAALKQSQQFYLPILHPMISFDEFIRQNPKGLIAHCHPGTKSSLFQLANPNGKQIILIGPEGDFSPLEVEKALEFGYQAIQLGDQRLRTETAGIVACHTVALKAQ